MKVLSILFGAGFAVALAFSLGSVLLRRLRIELYREEKPLFAFLTGSACLSAIMFVLCSTHLARKGVYLAIGAGAIAWALRAGPPRSAVPDLPPLPRLWRFVFLAIFGAFTVLYFFHAMAPEMSPDGTAYHLAVVDHYNRAHGFERVPTSIYFNISQGLELLFLIAFAFGKHSAAALLHCMFLMTLPWLMLAYGRRFGQPRAGTAAGLLVYASPVVGVDGLSAYVDVALAVVLFAMFYLLQIWEQRRHTSLLAPAAILAGFAFAIKYTACVAAFYALGWVAWKLWLDRTQPGQKTRAIRALAIMAALITLIALPWPLKNWMWVGNPAAPFANRLFPNPWVHVSFEEDFRKSLQHYELQDLRRIPLELTVRGEVLQGLLGPLFLLMPVGLLALRTRRGRDVLLAGAVFALPYATNIGTRFLIPSAPLFALAFAFALARWQWALLGAVLGHAVLSWPAVVNLYCAPYAWRVPSSLPVRAALRMEAEDSFLRRKWPGYAVDRLIEEKVPAGESVFLFATTAESYTTRALRVSYLSAPNETLRDMLWTPLFAEYQPSATLDFRFARQTVRKLRVVQRRGSDREMWSISELRVLVDGHEVRRAPQWRLTAQPNPWEVQLAFDNSPATRWKTWQAASTSDFVEIDFGGEQALDGVSIECSQEFTNRQIALEALDARDEWRAVDSHMYELRGAVNVNLRAAATTELKAREVRYLLVNGSDPGASDFRLHARLWHLTMLGSVEERVLYRIE